MRKGWIAGIAVAGVGLLSVVLGPRAAVDVDRVAAPEVPDDVEAWLAQREGAVADLRPDADKRIVWRDPETRERTPLSIVYLHGFSADRQEIAPVPQRVASALGANLFLTRLAGHGRTRPESMAEATAEAWLADGLEAVAVGQRLGERVVVMGTSTGGTLAVWLAAEGAPDAVDGLVLVSPNFHPADPNSDVVLWPWGQQLAELVVGPERSWEPKNEGQAAHWSWRYPTRSVVPMMLLVDLVDGLDLSRVDQPTLVVRSLHDTVVDPEATSRALARFGGVVEEKLIGRSDDPDHHVIAGDILSPGTTAAVAGSTVDFLRRSLPAPDSD